MNKSEKWKPIEGYEGKYEISTLGRVKGFKLRNGYKEHILKPLLDKDGYCKVNLYKNRKLKRISIHKLVALAFIPNIENKEQINHIDGNKENNCIDNLEWVTAKENIKHSIENELTKNTGGDNYRARKVICVTTGIKYNSISEASKETRVPHQNIVKVCQGKRNYAGQSEAGEKLIWEYEEE